MQLDRPRLGNRPRNALLHNRRNTPARIPIPPPWQPRLRALLLLLPVVLFAPFTQARADDPDNCLLCHQYRGLGRYDAQQDAVHIFYTDPAYHVHRLGPHARIACTDCHPRHEVNVIPHKDVSPVNCLQTCHLRDPGGLSRTFTHADAARILEFSVHNSETLAQLEFSAGPLLNPGQSQCLYCHDQPYYRDPGDLLPFYSPLDSQTLNRCDTCHEYQIPVDTTYYLRHVSSRLLHARPPLEQAQTCGVCHSDPLIKRTYDLQDSTIHFTTTYHGKAALLGELHTADCVSCHIRPDGSAHLVQRATNPESITHPQNRADACRSIACHPGADPSIARAAVRMDFPSMGKLEVALVVFFVIFTLLTFGPSLVITLLEIFQIVINRHVEGEGPMVGLTQRVLAHPDGPRRLERFTVTQRWQHWILALLFAALVATGFPMKFASHDWARAVIDAIGGLGIARTVHRAAGLALIIGLVGHLIYAGATWFRNARQKRPDGSPVGLIQGLLSLPMFVGPKDLMRATHLMGYLLGFRKKPPDFGRFSVDQKFEYFGVFWGTVLLGITGGLLWDAQFSSRFIDGRIFNLALIAHTYEAFLAVIHVGILHICNVTLAPSVFPLSMATITGATPANRLAEVHGEYVIQVARELGIAIPPEVQHD